MCSCRVVFLRACSVEIHPQLFCLNPTCCVSVLVCVASMISCATSVACWSLQQGIDVMAASCVAMPSGINLLAFSFDGLKRCLTCSSVAVSSTLLAIFTNLRIASLLLRSFPLHCSCSHSVWVSPPSRAYLMYNSSQVAPWLPASAGAHLVEAKKAHTCLSTSISSFAAFLFFHSMLINFLDDKMS